MNTNLYTVPPPMPGEQRMAITLGWIGFIQNSLAGENDFFADLVDIITVPEIVLFIGSFGVKANEYLLNEDLDIYNSTIGYIFNTLSSLPSTPHTHRLMRYLDVNNEPSHTVIMDMLRELIFRVCEMLQNSLQEAIGDQRTESFVMLSWINQNTALFSIKSDGLSIPPPIHVGDKLWVEELR